MLSALFTPFVNGSPITVMAAATLARLLSSEALDGVFGRSRQTQQQRKILFSSVFNLMASVVVGTRTSIHHAYQTTSEDLRASVVAVYDKLKRVEPSTSQAIVRDTAREVVAFIDQMGGAMPALLPGYRTKILDGNCLAHTQHRIKELRRITAGALPGKCLVVLDPRCRVMIDVFPCEDGHAQERSLLGAVLPTVEKDDLWIDDRNFCTFDFLEGIAGRGAFFITRLHGRTTCDPIGQRRKLGRVDGGVVYEQEAWVRCADGREMSVRRIEIELDKPTRDGETSIVVLTNLPSSGGRRVSGTKIAELYRERWTIEAAFRELTEQLNSEIDTLGYPGAALFGFCVALTIFNAIALMKAALRASHGVEKIEKEVSNFYIAAEIETTSRGMMVAIPAEHWEVFETMPAEEFVATLRMLADRVNLSHYKKHPRGPRKPQPKRKHDPKHNHVATSRLLAERKTQKPPGM